MSLKVSVVFVWMCFTSGWALTHQEKQCIATFHQDFDNSLLLGTWYRIVKLALFAGLPASTTCPTFHYQTPNSTELQRYKDEYFTPDIPYSFEDTPLQERRLDWPEGFEALLIGNKQAKFYIMDPSTVFHRPRYEVMIYQRLNDQYVLFQTCALRGHIRWLLSRNKNPPQAEVDAIIKSHPEAARLQRQRFCASS